MKTIPRTAALIVTVAVIGIAVMIGSSADRTARPGSDGVLELTIEDFAIEPSEFVVPAGEPVTLVFVNANETTHHLSFGRGVLERDGRPAAFAEDLLAGLDARTTPQGALIDPSAAVETTTLDVRGRTTVTLDVTVPPDRIGTWQVGCFLGPGCDPRISLAAELVVE